MTPELLEHFLVVAKYLNISRAAESLYLNHSSLGRQMSRLEDYYGTPLFIRNNRSVVLTPAGKVLAADAPALLKSINEVRSRVRRANMLDEKSLTIAMMDAPNPAIYTICREFRHRNPDISLTTRNLAPGGEIVQYVDLGIADLGLESSTKVEEYSGMFESVDMGELRYCVMVRPNHRLAKRGAVTVEDLLGERVVVMESEPPEKFFKAFGDEDEKLKQLLDSPYAAISWQDMVLQVEAGIGIAILPEVMAKNYVTDSVILDLEGQNASSRLVLFWKRENENPMIKKFVDFAIEFPR